MAALRSQMVARLCKGSVLAARKTDVLFPPISIQRTIRLTLLLALVLTLT